MTTQTCGDQPRCTNDSRFSEALSRLSRCLEQARDDEARVDTMYVTWQRRWAARRQEIAHRLEMIESQLSRIAVPAGKKAPVPQLVVFAAPADSEEMTADVGR
jgi:hypothetical protein